MSASRSLLQIWRETICTFKFQGEKVSSKNFASSAGKANSVLLGPWARHTTSALPRVRSRRQDDKCALKKFFNSVPGFLMGISSIQGTWWHHIKHSALYNIPSLCSDGSNTAEPSGFCITYLSGHKGSHLRSPQSYLLRMKHRRVGPLLGRPVVIGRHRVSWGDSPLSLPSSHQDTPLAQGNCCRLSK